MIPLRGATPEGGWDTELAADDNVHCLVELVTDEGLSGLGSVFTSGAALTRHAPLPIAGGEVLTRRQSFLPWIERRAVDYLQPDVTKVGGLTEEHRIGQYADDHNILLVPHGWNTAVGLAADLQLVAAAGNARWVEYLTPAAYIEDLLAEPLRLDAGGLLAIPDGPGLGLAFDPDGGARHGGGRRLRIPR